MISWSLNLRQRGWFSQLFIEIDQKKKIKGEVFGCVTDLNWHRFSFYFLYLLMRFCFDWDHDWSHFQQPRSSSKILLWVSYFNSLLGVWKCGKTRSFMFDMLLLNLILCNDILKPSKPLAINKHADKCYVHIGVYVSKASSKRTNIWSLQIARQSQIVQSAVDSSGTVVPYVFTPARFTSNLYLPW